MLPLFSFVVWTSARGMKLWAWAEVIMATQWKWNCFTPLETVIPNEFYKQSNHDDGNNNNNDNNKAWRSQNDWWKWHWEQHQQQQGEMGRGRELSIGEQEMRPWIQSCRWYLTSVPGHPWLKFLRLGVIREMKTSSFHRAVPQPFKPDTNRPIALGKNIEPNTSKVQKLTFLASKSLSYSVNIGDVMHIWNMVKNLQNDQFSLQEYLK